MGAKVWDLRSLACLQSVTEMGNPGDLSFALWKGYLVFSTNHLAKADLTFNLDEELETSVRPDSRESHASQRTSKPSCDGIPLRIKSAAGPTESFFGKLKKTSNLGAKRARFDKSIRDSCHGIYSTLSTY